MSQERFTKAALLVLALLISLLFLWMIRGFLLTLFLAAIFAGLFRPICSRLGKLTGGRRSLAAFLTLLFVILVVLLPLLSLLGIVTAQAIKVSESVKPWVQKYVSDPDALAGFLKGLPLYEKVRPLLEVLVQKAGEIISAGSMFLVSRFSSVAGATVQALFRTFIFLYALFFFLRDGERMLWKILYYLPLEDREEQLLLDRFTSVTRATLKGTLVIGVLQGFLAGIAFVAVGIPSAVFWGAVMTVLSIIPGIGTALVWVPAAVILTVEGSYLRAGGLTAYCVLVVGSIDNFLRPRLVGKDTAMHELTVFLGTMGGIVLFGIAGFIVGPIVAALFVTVWEIYGVAFREVLPGGGVSRGGESGPEGEEGEEDRS